MSVDCWPKENSVQKALLYGSFVEHCEQASVGTWQNRVVHVIMAALEVLPIIGQIVALFELAIFGCMDQRPEHTLSPSLPPLEEENLLNEGNLSRDEFGFFTIVLDSTANSQVKASPVQQRPSAPYKEPDSASYKQEMEKVEQLLAQRRTHVAAPQSLSPSKAPDPVVSAPQLESIVSQYQPLVVEAVASKPPVLRYEPLGEEVAAVKRLIAATINRMDALGGEDPIAVIYQPLLQELFDKKLFLNEAFFDLERLDFIPQALHKDTLFVSFSCPVNMTPIRTPVNDPTTPNRPSNKYERSWIEAYVRKEGKSPMTTKPILLEQLKVNENVLKMINKRLKAHSEILTELVRLNLCFIEGHECNVDTIPPSKSEAPQQGCIIS